MKIISVTLLLLSIFGADGYYLYDLFNIIDLQSVPGVTTVPGPKPGTQAYNFQSDTGSISTDSVYYAYIANSIINSNDVTFYCYFKFKEIKNLPENKVVYYTFFSLQDKRSITPRFSIRFGYQNVKSVNEDVVDVELKKSLYIDYQVDSYLQPTSIPVDNLVKADTWQMIMVKIQDNEFTVKLDCNIVKKGVLAGGKIQQFPYGGNLTIAQGPGMGGTVDGQFIGALYQATILVGRDAFEYYNPCITDRVDQVIPSEPRPEDVDRTESIKFVKLSSTNISPVRIYCKDKEGERRFSGTSWTVAAEQKCWRYTCNNGEIHSEYTCKFCKDPSTKKEYKHAKKWVDDNEPCTQYECSAFPRYTIYEDDLKGGCTTPLSCNKWGNQGAKKPPGQCCDKCWSDSCPAGREYYEGCDRPCNGGIDYECPVKKRGCWCPEGQSLNDAGECIATSDCVCKSGSKTYNPGQAVIRSQCETCVCAMGELICFKSCSY